MSLQGHTIQIYREAMVHYPQSSVEAMLDDLRDAGVRRIAWHGFVVEQKNGAGLEQAMPGLITLAQKHGLGACAAFGLGDAWDHRPVLAGTCIGRTALIPGCELVIDDAEGAFEGEPEDKARAHDLVEATRYVNPGAYVVHQPWWKPTVHWGWPWEEFEAGVDLDAAQTYFNNLRAQMGKNRYAWMMGGVIRGQLVEGAYQKAWKKLDARLAPKGLVRPRTITIQGYGGSDIFADTVDCLLCYPDAIVWCEPFPEAYFLRSLRLVKALRDRGFTGPTAIHDFEVAEGLTVEPGHGRAGPEVCRALGISLC